MPIGQVRHYSYHIKTMLSHVDSAILPRSCNHITQNEHSDLSQDTSRPSLGLLAVIRRIDRKERSRGKCTEHSVGNYHLKRQTKTNQDRPILYPHPKSVSMRKLKQRPTYPINSQKDNKYHQTHVRSKKEGLKSKESDRNKSFPKREISLLIEEIRANSVKLSEKVHDDNNQNDMLRKDTDRHRKGRKHLNNAYNGYLNMCICIIMYILVISKYVITGACQPKNWRLTATPALTKTYTLVKIITKVEGMHEKHKKKYRKGVLNRNPDVELTNYGIYDKFLDVIKHWRLTATHVLTKIYTLVKSCSKSSRTHENHCDNLQGNVLCMYSCLKICNSVEIHILVHGLPMGGQLETPGNPPPLGRVLKELRIKLKVRLTHLNLTLCTSTQSHLHWRPGRLFRTDPLNHGLWTP